MKTTVTIIDTHENSKAVKNLGWLLRNWRQVEWLGFNYYPESDTMRGGELIARLNDGDVYITEVASLSAAWNFVSRPFFKGLPFSLVKPDQHENNRREFTIGDNLWLKIQRLDRAKFYAFAMSDDKSPV